MKQRLKLVIFKLLVGLSIFAWPVQSLAQESVTKPAEAAVISPATEQTMELPETDPQAENNTEILSAESDDQSSENSAADPKSSTESLDDGKETDKNSEFDLLQARVETQVPPALGPQLPPSTVHQPLPDVDIATGALSYTVPLKVPLGRLGMQPNLSLSYNSQTVEEQTLLGAGWELGIPSIERKNLHGLNKLYESFDFSSSMDGDLKFTTESAGVKNFGAKHEFSSFNKYKFFTNETDQFWELRDKQGTVYTFGKIDQARVSDPLDQTRVYKWFLTEVKDVKGNSINFAYQKVEGQVYPSVITYTNNRQTTGVFKVVFVLEDRPDTSLSAKAGFAIKTTKRIRYIESYITNEISSKYEIVYTQALINNRSLISSLLYTGFNESGQSITEPLLNFFFESENTPLLISKIINNTGGQTTARYKSSSLYRNSTGTLLNPKLSFPVMTVERIEYDDKNGVVWGNSFEYSGGSYYFNGPFDRKFVGFGKVMKIDSAGTQQINYYHQGNGNVTNELDDSIEKAGKLYASEWIDSLGALFMRSVSKWQSIGMSDGRFFVHPSSFLLQTFDGNQTHKDKAESYSFDQSNGNVLEKTEWGEVAGQSDGTFVDIGTDKRATTMAYVSENALGVSALLAQIILSDQSGNKLSESKYYYDGLAFGQAQIGNQTKVEQWKSNSNYIATQKSYDSVFGLVLTETDPRGKVTSFSYDAHKLYPQTVTNSLNYQANILYDYSSGKPKQTTDANNLVTKVEYDGLDRVVAEYQPDLVSPLTLVLKTSYEYSLQTVGSRTKKVSYLDLSNSVEQYSYTDGFDRSIQTRLEAEDPNNFIVSDITYNTLAQKQKQSSPYFNTGSAKTGPTNNSALYTVYEYDPMLRIKSVQNSVGTTTSVYDDWKTSVIDARGNVRNSFTDSFDRLIKIEEINNSSAYQTAYAYDGLGNLTKLTDALGNIRNFSFDGLGHKLSAEDLHAATDTSFGKWFYSYDDAGNLLSTTDPKNQIVNYTYDNLNRVLTENYAGQNGVEVSHSYDTCSLGKGKSCSIVSAGATTSNNYNGLGLIAEQTKTIDGTSYKTTTQYDRQGNVVLFTNPDNSQIKNLYNSAGQLESIQRKESTDQNWSNVITNFNYSPTGQLSTAVFANGDITTNTYDATKLYRLSSKLTVLTGGIRAQDLSYTYDAVGNVTKVIDNSQTNSKKTVNFVYDQLNRLTSATATNVASGQTGYSEAYSYNAIGNLLSKTGQGNFVYSGVGYANPHAATSIGSNSISYDNNGNLLTITNGFTNTWDYQNRLIKSTKGKGGQAVNVTYSYDHSGQRVKLVAGNVTTYYPSASYTIEGATKVKNIYAGNMLVATVKGSGTSVLPYYVHDDHLKSSSFVTNASGVKEELLDYFPFGTIRLDEKVGSFNEIKKFIGQDYDGTTGLSYLNARYYNGSMGKFISQDPVFWQLPQELLVDPQQQNSYSYARNNPINRSDPTGLLNIVIPGTRYDEKGWDTNNLLYKNVVEKFGGTTWIYNDKTKWSGGDNRWARSWAVNNLKSDINQYKFSRDEKLNIIGHSHGGNVAYGLSNVLDRKIDALVTLGTPVRDDYQPNHGNIGMHINVYTGDDKVQSNGGYSRSLSGMIGQFYLGPVGGKIGNYLSFGEFGKAGRTIEGARNINVSDQTKWWRPFDSHSELWANEDVWKEVKLNLAN